MNYHEYIEYHSRGDAGAEERMIASLSSCLSLDNWSKFKLIYYYSMTYHIPSALKLLFEGSVVNKSELTFRTDRRYVRCNGAYEKLLLFLEKSKMNVLTNCKTTKEAYEIVKSWFFFGRYATFLFLEVYINCFQPKWEDNLKFDWDPKENYTKGAISIIGSNNKSELDNFLEKAKLDTKDNSFAIETSLCAVAKFEKGTRWDGFYTERMLEDASKSKDYCDLIFRCV